MNIVLNGISSMATRLLLDALAPRRSTSSCWPATRWTRLPPPADSPMAVAVRAGAPRPRIDTEQALREAMLQALAFLASDATADTKRCHGMAPAA
ncbi:hypothetical protein V4F39_23925 [Aquincola sp. MAHUQ-54]|uniref:Uncharacterized protein n=1 Tax=Aquincola agrisoli TaxID=3119538 RepID=A0AAW9QNJ9_9BURK